MEARRYATEDAVVLFLASHPGYWSVVEIMRGIEIGEELRIATEKAMHRLCNGLVARGVLIGQPSRRKGRATTVFGAKPSARDLAKGAA
jgi:hypothetical protein